MAGQIKTMLDKIISIRSKGDSLIMMTTKTKLNLKGINYNSYNSLSADDPKVIESLRKAAADLGVTI